MPKLAVLHCGDGTTLQDLGRFGYRRFGVPTAGAVDQAGMAVANALVGNTEDMAVIEFLLLGGEFRVEEAPVMVALSGEDCALSIDGRRIPDLQSTVAQPGERIRVGAVRGGVAAYLAVGGGFDVPSEMGSRSVHRPSGIGGRPLQSGDSLTCYGDTTNSRPKRFSVSPLPPRKGPIRVMLGPQEDYFVPSAVEALLSAEYVVHPSSDRMGCRLEGAALKHLRGGDIVSDGVLAGSIQVPGEGFPLILLRDCQTTGGYAKIATVISADLDRLGQMRPGTAIRFAEVSREQALDARSENQASLASLPSITEDLEVSAASDRLLTENLVGGVVDATCDDASG